MEGYKKQHNKISEGSGNDSGNGMDLDLGDDSDRTFGYNSGIDNKESVLENWEGKEEEPPLEGNTVLLVCFFILISLNEGFLLGYLQSLIAIFTESGSDSALRGLLVVAALPLGLRLIFAPLVDKYYITALGKRKTYIMPSKLFAAGSYIFLSFHLDKMVADQQIVLITAIFFTLLLILMIDNNALAGFRLDVLTSRRANSMSASYIISLIIGVNIGYTIFILFSSPDFWRQHFNVSEPILDHRKLFLIIAAVNIVSLFLLPLVKDNKFEAINKNWKLSNLRVLQILFSNIKFKRIMLWNVFATLSLLGLGALNAQYYIQAGIKKEDLVIIGISMVPFIILGNVLIAAFTKGEQLMTKLWLWVFMWFLVNLPHVINYSFFDPKTNYDRTFYTILIIDIFSSLLPWNNIQMALINWTSSKKYTASYSATITSVLAMSKIFPTGLFIAMVDKISFVNFIIIIYAIQIVLQFSTFGVVKKVDSIEYDDYIKEFDNEVLK